jgi:hypothetical protein
VLEKAGGVPILNATGHSLIKKRMKEEHALLAGELSGHIMFGDDYYGFDDALYGACLLIDIVARRGGRSRRVDRRVPEVRLHRELRYPATEETKFPIVARATEHFRAGPRGDRRGRRPRALRRRLGADPRLEHRARAGRPLRGPHARAAAGDPGEMEGWLAGEGIGAATTGH